MKKNNSQESEYRLVCFGGRPRLALPLWNKRAGTAFIRQFPKTTWRKKAFRGAVLSIYCTGLDKILGPQIQEPIGKDFEFNTWLNHVSQRIGVDQLIGGIVCPPQPDRARLYVHLIDEQGMPHGFAKVSFDEENDRLLAFEVETIRYLRRLRLKLTYQPEILLFDRWAGYSYVLFEPLPPQAKPVPLGSQGFPEKWVNEYAGKVRHLTCKDVEHLLWWQCLLNKTTRNTAFLNRLEEAVNQGVEVCRMHGDFGVENMAQDGNCIWLFDWEHSSGYAPQFTDRLRFWIQFHRKVIYKDPKRALELLYNSYLNNCSKFYKAQVILALGYLNSVDISHATRLVENWTL